MTTKAKNHLSSNHYTNPGKHEQVMTRAELTATILETSGRVCACGYLWDIVNTRIGPGAYRIKLKRYEST